MLDFLFAPFAEPFMLRAILVALAVSLCCAVFSCFLVLRGWSLMGDALSHAVLPGVVLSYVAGWPLAFGAFAAGTLCSGLIAFVTSHSRLKEDTVMGVVFSGLFAVGLVLMSRIQSDIHLMHILFGNILGVSWQDVGYTALMAVLVLSLLLAKKKDFLLYCFDATYTKAIGLHPGWLHYGLLLSLALVIVVALQAVGILLVTALLIGPGATGFLLCQRFSSMMAIAVSSALASALIGTWLSYIWDVATAPLIVLCQFGLCVMAMIYGRRRTLSRLDT